MGLTKCTECKHKISDEAKACPNCGQPDPQPVMKLWRIIKMLFALAVVGAILWGIGQNP